MGCGGSSESQKKPEVTEEDKKREQVVNAEVREAEVEDSKVRKLLLLGAGGSGKSTFFKQLTKLHGGGFQARDKKTFRSQMYEQLIEAMKTMIVKCEDLVEEDEDANEGYALEDELETSSDFILATRSNVTMNDELAGHLKRLWESSQIKQVYELRNIICVPESTGGFLDRLDEIKSPEYIPSDEDLMLVRYRTTGMAEKTFQIEEHLFQVCDVGGQRNERRKWIHFFDGVTAVLFVAALSSYDEATFEDENANGMQESLEVFKEYCNSHHFQNTAFILFLNKKDLFDIKITKKIPISIAFPEYKGANTIEESLAYIEKAFEDSNAHPEEREIYTHVTCATDTDQVKKVFTDVQHIVIQWSLERSGLLA